MAFGPRKNESNSSDVRETAARLPKTMPSRFSDDDSGTGPDRGAGHETTYQSSRGSWRKPRT
jgi:hypothetical protein